jgi:hypothetical protein
MKEHKVKPKRSDLDVTVRELIDRFDKWDFVVNDGDGNHCLVVLPLMHFLRLRERTDDQGWWELREAVAEDIQLAMGLPDNPTIRDMIEFGQR